MKRAIVLISLLVLASTLMAQTIHFNGRVSDALGQTALFSGSVTALPPNNVACGSANVPLGNGWTLVDCAAQSSSFNVTTTLSLVHNQAVPAHSTIVLMYDSDQTGTDLSGSISCSDNAGNTFTKDPMGYSPNFPNGTSRTVIFTSYWYVLDSNAKASGYQATCTFTTTGTSADTDMSVMVFKQNSGLASRGVDTFIPWNSGNTASGPCPCEIVPGGQTITVNNAGDLVLAGGNMNGGYVRLDPPFVGVDGDGGYVGPAYYTAEVTSSAPGQTFTFHWYTDAPNTGRTSVMFAFLSSQ